MITTKKLIQMAKKWQKLAVANRRKISWAKPVAEKGHFVVYTMDGRRFMIPLTYLKSEILMQLFRMAEDEFGAATDRPITLPCDSAFMEYAINILQRHATKDVEEALILSLGSCRSWSSSTSQPEQTHQHLLVNSF